MPTIIGDCMGSSITLGCVDLSAGETVTMPLYVGWPTRSVASGDRFSTCCLRVERALLVRQTMVQLVIYRGIQGLAAGGSCRSC